MKHALRTWIIAGVAIGACMPSAPSQTTGLAGVVLRGPVTPVCRVSEFTSDTAGQFTVFLAPGAYTVIPDADAPIISPSSQKKSVTVDDTGSLTMVRLTFDTGLR